MLLMNVKMNVHFKIQCWMLVDFCNILVNIRRKQLVDQEGQHFQVSHLLWVIRILFRNVIAKQKNALLIVDCMTVISLCPIFQFHRSEVVVCRIAYCSFSLQINHHAQFVYWFQNIFCLPVKVVRVHFLQWNTIANF